MKRFMAIYTGTASAADKAAWAQKDPAEIREIEARGMAAWGEWMGKHSHNILDSGAPLGRTKRAFAGGVEDATNTLTGYIIVQAETHEAAARMFEQHPHFAIFRGDSVEIMEILPIPGA